MTIQEANNVSIKIFLSSIGINPVKEKESYGMYHSPFREDKTASMKVDFLQNLWYDFGTGEGGTMLDLMMKMNDNCNLHPAIGLLENRVQYSGYFSFHGKSYKKPDGITIQQVKPLENIALLSYLSSRKISMDIAKLHCNDVYYKVGSKQYFAIGFSNNDGGFELRNKYFKGSSSPKTITTFDNQHSACMVFEGFIDYLSYLTLKKQSEPKANVLVLNSTAHLQKALDFINKHDNIHVFADNDEAGKQLLKTIQSTNKTVIDQSVVYKNCNDLNEYLCSSNRIDKPKSQYKMKR